MALGTNLDLHLKNVQNKVNKTIGLQNTLPRTPLITIFNSFLRPLLDHGDIIYDRACNTSFHQTSESIQYNEELPQKNSIKS